ncbi:MAG: Maf-like protein, partial [Deltaproteobacteria bacterium]
MPLVLASGSPRRRQLLTAAGVDIHAVRPPQIPEEAQPGEAPVAFARRIAVDKASAVSAPGHWVLAADTVVHLDGHILGKPEDDDDARRMLTELSGRWHRVTSAWCLRWGGGPTPSQGRLPRILRG